MTPLTKFSAMFLWSVLLIAVVGIAVGLAHSMWVATLAWLIVAGGASACLIRLQQRRAVRTRGVKSARGQREQRAHRDRHDGTGWI
ncbi:MULTISPECIES: hypothetical protein [Rhodococcus]|uniref:hypothetical protein n=1 Tax=Rhodococcus TaxID=1827 RepID=UPI000641F9FA|nr:MULTISPECIES: hypothetical protein [Rhodococcus]KLN70445.1 hypothetical protein ABM90_17130 [Rhodococcus erythropolis]